MKSYHVLAWKELLAQRVTSVLILIAVILSTITTTVIGQSIGILNAMREQQAITINGEKYATFLQMSEDQLSELKKDSRLSYIGPSISLGTIDLNSQLTLGLTEYIDNSLDAYPSISQIQEGRLPEQAMEIALPEDALEFLDFDGEVGDTISLSVSKSLRHDIAPSIDFTADFVLVGITKSNYIGYSYGEITGIVGAGTASQLLPEEYLYYNVDFCTADKRTFQDTVNDLIEKLQIHELDTSYNQVYLQACGIQYDSQESSENSGSGFSFMVFAGVVVGVLILLAAGLVIYNILKISVSKRIKEYGVLRAIGSEKSQLYTIVSLQILILCLIGIPVGMIAGLLSTKGIIIMATSFLSPEIFMVQNTSELQSLISANSSGKIPFLAASAVITLFFAFVAAIPAATYAAKVPPTVAMSGQNTRIKRRNRKSKTIRNFEAYYARLNLKRNRGRTAITVLSLVMSIAVFIALQSFTTLLNTASGMENSHLGDYSIVNETVGFSTDDLNELRQNSAVSSVAAIQFSLYEPDEDGKISDITLGFTLQSGETFQIVGLNDEYWDYFTAGEFSEEELGLLKSGEACIVRNPLALSYGDMELDRTTFVSGETISVAGMDIPIIATLDGYDGYVSVGNSGFTNGVQVIVSDRIYSELTGSNVYNEMCPVLNTDADRELFDTVVEKICQDIPGTTYLSYEDTDRQLEESFEQIRLLAWGLILFVGLIGLLNIINTVYTNIHTRVMEIGMQRAIGMSAGSLYKTFLWEGAYYGIIAAVIGNIVGYICTIFVNAATTDTIQLVSVPILPIVEATVLSIGACLLATCIPLKKIAGMSIVDSIETVE
ncbi:MAG: ABC transporter permease [Suilimivivens sp.]